MKLSFTAGLILALSVTMNLTSQAQNISIPDTLEGWDKSWVASLNGSQAAYNNWAQGGVSSISGTGSSVYTQVYQKELFSYGFRANLKYGQSHIKGQGVRKTDDLIEIRNRFNYQLNTQKTLSAYGVIGFRTQFDEGYEYSNEVGVPDALISDFMAPAYLNEGVGLAYEPGNSFTFQAGVGLKQTIVNVDNLAPVYGLEPGENIKGEGGITTGITFEDEVFEDIVFLSALETFTNLLIPVDETDVMWSNELVGKINNIVSASFQFELRYDNDFSSEIQLKQVLSAGVSVSLY